MLTLNNEPFVYLTANFLKLKFVCGDTGQSNDLLEMRFVLRYCSNANASVFDIPHDVMQRLWI